MNTPVNNIKRVFLSFLAILIACNANINGNKGINIQEPQIDREDCFYMYNSDVKNNCGICHRTFNNELALGGFTLHDLVSYNKDSLKYLYAKCINIDAHKPIRISLIDSIVFKRYCDSMR